MDCYIFVSLQFSSVVIVLSSMHCEQVLVKQLLQAKEESGQ